MNAASVLIIVVVLVVAAAIYFLIVRSSKKPEAEGAPPQPVNIDALVILPSGDETNGLGTIFGKLFRQVFEQNPERLAILKRMNVAIGIQDTIIEATAITMTFRDESVTIENGVSGKPDIYVEGDIETLVTIPSMARSPMNVLFTPEGREILGKFLKKELKVQGLFGNIDGFRNFRRLIK